MARGLQGKPLRRDGGRNAVVIASETGAGQQRVDKREYAGAFDKGMSVAADLAGEGDKDAVNFFLLFFEEADEFVVLLNGLKGLNVDSLAGGAGAVHDSRDAALELAANGNDEAVAADGDEVFLRGAFAYEFAQGRAERLLYGALLSLLLAADAIEFGRCVVGKVAVGKDFALDGFG